MGVKTLADGRIRLAMLPTVPANIDALKVADLAGAVDLSCSVMKSDFVLGPTGSGTVDEQEMCKAGEGKAFGPTAYEGSVTVFRYLDEAGKPVAADDGVFTALRTKGTEVCLVVRTGPDVSAPWAAGDEYEAYVVTTDEPQVPSDRFTGYIKWKIPLAVSAAARFKALVA